MLTDFDTRFQDPNVKDRLDMSTALDPRFSDLSKDILAEETKYLHNTSNQDSGTQTVSSTQVQSQTSVSRVIPYLIPRPGTSTKELDIINHPFHKPYIKLQA